MSLLDSKYYKIEVDREYGIFEEELKLKFVEINLSDWIEQNKNVLYDMGYIHKESAQEIEDKKLFEKRFFIMHKYGGISEIYPENITNYEAENLANDDTLVQAVNIRSVLSEESLKTYNKAINRKKREEKKNEQARATRAAKKKERELAKAKKLLKEAGEL